MYRRKKLDAYQFPMTLDEFGNVTKSNINQNIPTTTPVLPKLANSKVMNTGKVISIDVINKSSKPKFTDKSTVKTKITVNAAKKSKPLKPAIKNFKSPLKLKSKHKIKN